PRLLHALAPGEALGRAPGPHPCRARGRGQARAGGPPAGEALRGGDGGAEPPSQALAAVRIRGRPYATHRRGFWYRAAGGKRLMSDRSAKRSEPPPDLEDRRAGER